MINRIGHQPILTARGETGFTQTPPTEAGTGYSSADRFERVSAPRASGAIAVNINQSDRGTNPLAVNINQSDRGTNPLAVNINNSDRRA